MSLANNVDFLGRLPKLNRLNRLSQLGLGLPPGVETPLVDVLDFGPNPGGLRMFAFIPEHLQRPRALVVVLHGCGQTVAGYDQGAGWSTLARQFGFALLMPEQVISNNANGCFNWFNPEDIARDRGEAASIRQMVARMVEDHDIDPHRIFITGLSAGGAMTSVMLATYPEVFSAGAIIAGLPYGVAHDVREALTIMRATPVRTPRRLGDLVRKASQHKGPWPRLSVWHGSVDGVVAPANAREIVKQWLDVHHLPQAPMSEGLIDGHPRRVWWNADGKTLVESYTITGMAHGTPLGIADNEQRYGAPGAFMLEAGISSSFHIAKFFGLTSWIGEPEVAAEAKPDVTAGAKSHPKVAAKPGKPRKHTEKAARPAGVITPVMPPLPMPDFTEVFDPAMRMHARPEQKPKPEPKPEPKPKKERGGRGIDVGAVITRALTAAGLMK